VTHGPHTACLFCLARECMHPPQEVCVNAFILFKRGGKSFRIILLKVLIDILVIFQFISHDSRLDIRISIQEQYNLRCVGRA
jgi:hypothetical protein